MDRGSKNSDAIVGGAEKKITLIFSRKIRYKSLYLLPTHLRTKWTSNTSAQRYCRKRPSFTCLCFTSSSLLGICLSYYSLSHEPTSYTYSPN